MIVLVMLIACMNATSIQEQIKDEGILHPEIVFAQARLETGNFTSKAYREKHNLFGFTVKGELKEFASDRECIRYYKRWQSKWYDDERNYYDFLDCLWKHRDGTCARYASDTLYTKKLKEFQLIINK